MKLFKSILFLSLAVLAFSCKKDDNPVEEPHDEHEHELITTVIVELNDGTNTLEFEWTDPDGEGGEAPEIETIALAANTTYSVALRFVDESDAHDHEEDGHDHEHGEDITPEILEEGDEHLICFTSTGAVISVERTDEDANRTPIGLSSTWATTDAGTGNMNIVLRHQPGSKSGVNCDAGETDIDVTFPVTVQ